MEKKDCVGKSKLLTIRNLGLETRKNVKPYSWSVLLCDFKSQTISVRDKNKL